MDNPCESRLEVKSCFKTIIGPIVGIGNHRNQFTTKYTIFAVLHVSTFCFGTF